MIQDLVRGKPNLIIVLLNIYKQEAKNNATSKPKINKIPIKGFQQTADRAGDQVDNARFDRS